MKKIKKKIKLNDPDNNTIAVVLGGNWTKTSYSGSRYSNWSYAPTNSASNFSSRGISNHFKG